MTTMYPYSLSDAALLAEAIRAAGCERHATADLVAILAEVDSRRPYLGQGCPSLFCPSVAAGRRERRQLCPDRVLEARHRRRGP